MQIFTILSIIQTLQEILPHSQWTISNRLELGLISTNYAFIQAKNEGQNPVQYAANIVLKLQTNIVNTNLKGLVKIDNTGPFINLDLTPNGWQEISKNLANPELNIDEKKAVLLEYVSPNVAKPLHVGHMRNADIGECLYRVMKLKYPNIITDNHWGDWGVQFGILLWAWQQFEEIQQFNVVINDKLETVRITDYELAPIDTLVKLYVWGNQQKVEHENFDEIVRNEFKQLEKKEPKRLALWEKFVNVSKQEIATDLQLLNVTPHTIEQGESFYENDMAKLQEFCDKNGLWKQDGQARYFDFDEIAASWPTASDTIKKTLKKLTHSPILDTKKTEKKEDHNEPKVGRGYLISSLGYTTYLFRDVATRWQWARDHNRNLVITLTDHSQAHNFDQAFVIISYLASLPQFQQFAGIDVSNRLNFENLVHIPYGYLTLPEGKMSTRKGNFLTARNLINSIIGSAEKTLLEKNEDADKNPDFAIIAKKVAIAALKWFDLSRDCIGDLVLDIPKILQFEGNTGVYQLYTLARLRSIISKNETTLKNSIVFNASLLNKNEVLILKKMAQMPIMLEAVVAQYKPHYICNQLYEVSSDINSWYAIYNVSNELDAERKSSLLAFCELVANFLSSHLELLGIESVESM